MPRRRRRLALKHLGQLVLLALLSLLATCCAFHHSHQQQHFQHLQHQYQQHPQNSNHNNNQLKQEESSQTSGANLCSLLPHQVAKHLKLCRLINHSRTTDEAISSGAARGLSECRAQFKQERWNCSHAQGDHHLLTDVQTSGNRESAFVQAITAAGVVHAVAQACSSGYLADCACDKTRVGMIRAGGSEGSIRGGENWKWGGCSHNVRHGMNFARQLGELLDAVQQHSADRKLVKRSLATRNEHNQLESSQTTTAPSQLCLKNQSLSQVAHQRLLKSVLASDSLERHHEFRLAVNMHNNKIGRMAVARKMDLKCRCHGLSGSCSLKTCWLSLPDFQVIGAYLRAKYESSVHLPAAINVNKLIPMMDREEISNILGKQPALANQLHVQQSSEELHLATPNQPAANPTDTPTLLKIHEQQGKQTNGSNEEEADELQIGQLAPPMSQQQFQALLRETRLCNSTIQPVKPVGRRTLASSQQPKSANQQLSHLLHSQRDELVHLYKSPDYCYPNLERGFAGVKGRVCSTSSSAPEACDKLCCGRGFTRRVQKQSHTCECKFQYCCSIKCFTCEREFETLVCN